MFSLQRVLGGDGEFFVLLEQSAEQSALSAKVLLDISQKPLESGINPLLEIRNKNESLTQNLSSLLCSTFLTPLDRDEIEKLATALYKIPKTLEKFMKQLIVSKIEMNSVDFTPQIRIIAQSAELVLQMVKDLRHCPEIVAVKKQNDQLQVLEGEADTLLLNLIKDLFSGRYKPLHAFIFCLPG